VREVLESYSDPTVRQASLCFAAQTAKTMTELIALAYAIDQDPGPTMFVMPSQATARSLSEQRIQPMIDDSKLLARHKLADKHKYKIEEMSLDTMTIYMRWAGSATALASVAIKNLFMDEVDKWELASNKESDPINLAVERTKTFHNHMIFASSTPTTEDGRIWILLNSGDYREYHVPCPQCEQLFVLKWEHVKFDADATEEEIRRGTFLECPACRGAIYDKDKRGMLQRGQWCPRNPGADPQIRSYHLSELYAPWTKWGELAVKFVSASKKAKVGEFEELQNFVNSSLAEPWKDIQEAVRRPEDIEVLGEQERPEGVVPAEGVRFLTCGADTQDHGFYYVVRAWGDEMESWMIRGGFVESLEGLARVVWDAQYHDVHGRPYVVGYTLIDAMGHRTSEVYDFCRQYGQINPTKGEQRMGSPTKPTRIDYYPGTTKAIPGGVTLIRVNTTYYKDWLNNKLMIAAQDPGAFHLHAHPSSDYIRQMTAEYRDEKGLWQCPSHRDNHFWDCEVLSLVAADVAGVKYMPDLYGEEAATRRPEPLKPRKKKFGRMW